MAVENALAVVGVLNQAGYQLPEKAQAQLVAAGFNTPVKQAEAVSIAIMAGMDPQWLSMPKNIIAIGQAYNYVTQYGAIPGRHFYATPYEKKEKKGKKANGDDNWEVVGIEYAIVESVNWMQSSVAEHGRQSGLTYVLETRPVLGERLNDLLDLYAPEGYVKDPGNRGAEARYVIYTKRGDVREGEWQFGYYLAKGVKYVDNWGKTKFKADDSKMPSDTPNNSPQKKAERRAIRAACRIVTREMFPVGGASVQERLKGVAALAYNKALELVDKGDVRRGLDAEAYDADPETERPDDDGVVDGEYTPVLDETQQEADAQALAQSVGAVDLAVVAAATFDALPVEMQKLVNSIRGARSDTLVLDDAMARLRGWIDEALKPLGVNAAEELDAGLTVRDLIIRVIFGGKVGENVNKEQAQIAWKVLAKMKGKNWEFVPDGEGALLVREVYTKALEAFNSDVVDTF